MLKIKIIPRHGKAAIATWLNRLAKTLPQATAEAIRQPEWRRESLMETMRLFGR